MTSGTKSNSKIESRRFGLSWWWANLVKAFDCISVQKVLCVMTHCISENEGA